MAFKALFLLKPVLYFVLLLVAAKLFQSPDRPRPGVLRLGVVALGRVAAGLLLGPLVFLGGAAGMGRSAAAGIVVLALTGFGLWFAASRLAFGSLRPERLVAFAITAEAVSLGMDFLLMQNMGKFRMC